MNNILFNGHRIILETQYEYISTFSQHHIDNINIMKNLNVDKNICTREDAIKLVNEYFDMFEKMEKI
jgi:hypothetical protein